MHNKLKEIFSAGKQALGMFLELEGHLAAECLGLSGLDFFIADAEHGTFDVKSAAAAIIAGRLRGIEPLVRTQDSTRPSVLKMLDIGAAGLIVPYIQNLDEVKRLVEFAKYAPLGSRGFAWTRSAGFGKDAASPKLEEHFNICNAQTMLIPQCETAGCLAQVERIADLAGVDGIFVGPYDLSIALGVPGELTSPILQSAINRILEACKSSGKLAFIYSGDAPTAKQRFEEGFDAVACGMDVLCLMEAVQTLVAKVKG